ncbi:hypothetical protein PQO01_12550 [Lentisphaera marina]|uniref:hypothetical protein n=1 Tax=Lentisphaera marina TaxID=1111041 RepID=UPI00236604F2|nr:hypothetical protein [Lentisphaera marina]MDD7985782.1 hypothetical protein [Lentisphaera marina]
MKKLLTGLMTLATIANTSFAEDSHKGHDHSKHADHGHGDHEPHPGHGGEVLKVGTSALLWYAHMEKTGKFKIVLFNADGKSPKLIEKVPRLNLALKSGRKQLKFLATNADSEGKTSTFELQDDLLKAHIHGQISIKVDGKSYMLNLIDH